MAGNIRKSGGSKGTEVCSHITHPKQLHTRNILHRGLQKVLKFPLESAAQWMNLPTTEARSTPAVTRNVKKNRSPATVNYLLVSS